MCAAVFDRDTGGHGTTIGLRVPSTGRRDGTVNVRAGR